MALLDLTGLDDLKDLAPAVGTAAEAPLDMFIEDPDQPRQQFTEEAIQELADSIKAVGRVLKPIHVRPPNEQGIMVIVDGARRFRASARAGMATIRYLVDHESTGLDQLTFNAHNEDLSPREIGDMIYRTMTQEKLSIDEVCAKMGRKEDWVSRHIRIAHAPEEIRQFADRCRDYRALSSLVQAYEENPDFTLASIRPLERIRRSDVDEIHVRLKQLQVAGRAAPEASSKEAQAPAAAQHEASETQPAAPVSAAPETHRENAAAVAAQVTPENKPAAKVAVTLDGLLDEIYNAQASQKKPKAILGELGDKDRAAVEKALSKAYKQGVSATDTDMPILLVDRLASGVYALNDPIGFYSLVAFMLGYTQKNAAAADIAALVLTAAARMQVFKA